MKLIIHFRISLIIITFGIAFGLFGAEFSTGNWINSDIEISAEDIEEIPNGGHTLSIMESWLPAVILSNPDTGGFALMESPRFSIYGESTQWQRYHLNGLDISSASTPGSPALNLPVLLLQSLSINSILSHQSKSAGIDWKYQTDNNLRKNITIASPGYLGGPDIIPPYTVDKEPVFSWGAPAKTRQFGPSLELSLLQTFRGIQSLPMAIFIERIQHQRTFVNLDGYENAIRLTAMLSAKITNDIDTRVFYQSKTRDFSGIENGYDASITLQEKSETALWQGEWINESLQVKLNASYSTNRYTAQNPVVWDLVEEALLNKPPVPESTKSWFVTADALLKNFWEIADFHFSGSLLTRMEGANRELLYPEGVFARTYFGRALDIVQYDIGATHHEEILRVAPNLMLQKEWGKHSLNVQAGTMVQTAFSDTFLLGGITPTVSARAEIRPWEKFGFFTGLMHDSIALTAQEAVFSNPKSPSGGRYSWNDDGNLSPSSNELGNIYNTTGGQYHRVDPALELPSKNEFYLGLKSPFANLWETTFSIHGKQHVNLLTVKYAPDFDAGISEVSRSDISTGIGFNRDASSAGKEHYILTNQSEPAYYAGMEIQLLKKESADSKWFINFTIGAYLQQAKTVIGNGPDYNDIGQISESSADPNKQINTLARTDFDRAYVIHFLFGFHPFKNMSVSNILRYRDGEPFGQIYIVEGLNQGPTIIQNQERSQPPLGMPRFTFFTSWDIRLLYKVPVLSGKINISFDIFNVLNLHTELSENTFYGEAWRDPLESSMERSFKIALGYTW